MSNEEKLPAKGSVSGRKVAIIGGGVIGASWAALFLANGMRVTVSDPADSIESKVISYIDEARPSLLALGYPEFGNENLSFEKDLAKAVADADYVQENGPERLEFKIDLWSKIERAAPASALLLSSSSGIAATKQSAGLKQPGRLVIGHPFNPPHLLPLVEVVPGEQTPPELTARAMAFYQAVGKAALEIRKEMPGFVANRLQSAIFRECVSLVARGVVSVEDLDKIVVNSVGIRWATGGPFLSFHLGGGEGGFAHFLEHLTPGMESRWKDQAATTVQFDEATKKILLDQITEAYGASTIAELNAERDVKQVAVQNGLARVAHQDAPGAGRKR
ncbi:3-hydroxyacyl-CoA dehydrogenase NAD-binding domain-containing protein [Achromobacter aloeverae]